MRISQLGKDRQRISLIVAHQSRRTEWQHEQLASYIIAGRDFNREQPFERYVGEADFISSTLLYKATMIIGNRIVVLSQLKLLY